MRPWATRTLNGLAGLSLIAVAGWSSFNLFYNRDEVLPPRVTLAIHLDPTTVHPGDHFKVYAHVRINKLCGREIIHWTITREGTGVAAVEVVEQAPNAEPLGDSDIIHDKFVPADTAPGDYDYSATIFDDCGPDHRISVSVPPTLKLKVIPR